jgi:hypothetical protein
MREPSTGAQPRCVRPETVMNPSGRHMTRVVHCHPCTGIDGTPRFWLLLACGHHRVIPRQGRRQLIMRVYCRRPHPLVPVDTPHRTRRPKPRGQAKDLEVRRPRLEDYPDFHYVL